jgi:hypothetical protein
VDVARRVQHDSPVVDAGGAKARARREPSPVVVAALAAAVALPAASCARPPTRVSPPTAPAVTHAAAPRSSPVAGPSVPLAALTGAAGRPLWSRAERPGDRAVTVGDAVVAVEGPPPGGPTAASPAGAAPAPPGAAPSGGATFTGPYRLVVMDATSGAVRATHRLGDAAGTPGSSTPVPATLIAAAFRRAPVAAVSLAGPPAAPARSASPSSSPSSSLSSSPPSSSRSRSAPPATPSSLVEEAYDPKGRRVWRAPRAGLALVGDDGEYTATWDSVSPAGTSPAQVHELKSLSGADVTAFGPANGEQVAFVHGGAAVVVRGGQFRIATVARHPRTLWASSTAAPHGYTGAAPIAVLGDRLLVQWNGGGVHHPLALYDLATGRQAWRTESLPGEVTPRAVAQDAGSHIAVIGSDGIGPTLGLDVRTGKVAWRLSGQRAFRPVVAGHGRVYGASGDQALSVDARTGRATTLGTHVEIVGRTADGILVLRGLADPATGRIWAFRG